MASSQNIAAYVPTVHSSGVSSGSSIGNTDAASGKVVVKGGVKDIDSGTSRITEEDNQDSDTVRSRRRKSVNPATIGSMLTEAGFRVSVYRNEVLNSQSQFSGIYSGTNSRNNKINEG